MQEIQGLLLHGCVPCDVFSNGIYGTDKPTEGKGLWHRKLKYSQAIVVISFFHFYTKIGCPQGKNRGETFKLRKSWKKLEVRERKTNL